ncbi:FtsW/RodA/SpoVE family cell cycle protein [Patescibacteria group bacterium]|nr:FtsW/RodA/SpoVE family cell cycle protein [Patescibacteria group bacterium]
MASGRGHADRILFSTIVVLVVGGMFIFLSASLGLLAGNGPEFGNVARNQLLLGLGGGIIAFLIGLNIHYRFWRGISLYLFLGTAALSLLVFTPLGLELNGARRWIDFGIFTLQPAEFLKIGYILYLATWLSTAKSKIGDLRYGLLPFGVITGAVGALLLLQPDTDTFMIIALSGLAMFVAAGAKIRDIMIIILIGVIAGAIVITFRPYVADRITSFLNPGNDPQGTGYQIQQSLMAVGAGEIFGRGFGQSVQKFGKLPEPTSDSIFSVFAEEAGFVGASALVITYLVFALRGFWVAARAPDVFGGLAALGIVVLIVSESYLNIAAMLGVFPLSGLPLVFVSHGGSALLASLAAAGILLSVSRSVHS